MNGQLDIIGQDKAKYVLSHFADIDNFPKPGIVFKDIMPAVADAKAFDYLIEAFVKLMPKDIKYIVGIEARGFIIGAPLAQRLGIGFIPLRKAGKLPPPVKSITYSLEYGQDTLEIQDKRIAKDDKIFVLDDVIATGGTVDAAKNLLKSIGAKIAGFGFVIELTDFEATKLLQGYKIISLYKIL
ncbi:MAG: adenine phosphoribosyltransferase [Bifidobacteriaceae bacterium]|jgi:adenine phosphoribosyltransferase|nr:adenine phosphoribosyltransferase [Bifidobacteriaceae bacterium]